MRLDRYLINEAEEREFSDKEIKQLNKAFEKDHDGDDNDPYSYALRGKRTRKEENYIDIQKTNKGFEVKHTVSMSDGSDTKGTFDGMKEKKLSDIIKKLLRRI